MARSLMIKLERVTDLEKTVLEKMNCLLEHHWVESRNLHSFYFVYNPESEWDRVRIDGSCLGRRSWQSLLQVVNAFAKTLDALIPGSPLAPLYAPFRGFSSKSLEELAIKVDLALQDISRSDDLHKYRILCASSS